MICIERLAGINKWTFWCKNISISKNNFCDWDSMNIESCLPYPALSYCIYATFCFSLTGNEVQFLIMRQIYFHICKSGDLIQAVPQLIPWAYVVPHRPTCTRYLQGLSRGLWGSNLKGSENWNQLVVNPLNSILRPLYGSPRFWPLSQPQCSWHGSGFSTLLWVSPGSISIYLQEKRERDKKRKCYSVVNHSLGIEQNHCAKSQRERSVRMLPWNSS